MSVVHCSAIVPKYTVYNPKSTSPLKCICSSHTHWLKPLSWQKPELFNLLQSDDKCVWSFTLSGLSKILQKLSEEGWSAENVFFGCGSALLQKLNRDTLSCAFKCSYVETNGKGVSRVGCSSAWVYYCKRPWLRVDGWIFNPPLHSDKSFFLSKHSCSSDCSSREIFNKIIILYSFFGRFQADTLIVTERGFQFAQVYLYFSESFLKLASCLPVDGRVQAAGDRPIQEVKERSAITQEKLWWLLGDSGERSRQTWGG